MVNSTTLNKHFVATGFVLNRDHTKLLMVHHRKLNKWAAPGGHVEPDETPAEAALREIREETGVEAEIIDRPNMILAPKVATEAQLETPFAMLSEYIPEHGEVKAHIHLDFIFICEADENAIIDRQEKEVKEVKWMAKEDILASNTFDSIRMFAKHRLD